ncbi:MAG: biotin/lipoyl-binding protein, partial [Planctomycetes bacterium]|nr:biotin/lipoyl-binding protein [Planctomycetota bacterium]
LPPEATKVEPLIPWSPMPGGALTANTQMLRDNGIMDKYPEVIAAMGETVRRGGFGTSVTPVSQFYFQQAFNNVMFGPWEKFAPGYGKMVLGYFGKTPVPPDPEIVKLASEKLNLEPTTRSPLDINDEDPSKGCEAANEKLKEAQLEITDENTFIAATCGDKGIAFLKGEAKTSVRKIEPEKKKTQAGPRSYTVSLSGRDYAVTVDGSQAIVDGQTYEVEVKESQADTASVDKSAPAATGDQVITAQLPGSIIKIIVKVGDVVKEGDALMVIEAMKMESEIKAGFSGTVTAIPVSVGDQVAAGDVLVRVG